MNRPEYIAIGLTLGVLAYMWSKREPSVTGVTGNRVRTGLRRIPTHAEQAAADAAAQAELDDNGGGGGGTPGGGGGGGRPAAARPIAVPIPPGGPGIQAYRYTINGTGVRFRGAPVNGEVLYALNTGDVVIAPDFNKAQGTPESGAFIGVVDPFNGQHGWVSSQFLTNREPVVTGPARPTRSRTVPANTPFPGDSQLANLRRAIKANQPDRTIGRLYEHYRNVARAGGGTPIPMQVLYNEAGRQLPAAPSPYGPIRPSKV